MNKVRIKDFIRHLTMCSVNHCFFKGTFLLLGCMRAESVAESRQWSVVTKVI